MDKAKSSLSIIIVLSIVAILISGLAIAGKGNNGKNKPFELPPNAVEVAPGIFNLGYAFDVSGRVVEGYAIFHHKTGHTKGGSGDDTGGSTCYAFLANGAKWQNVEDYIVDPTNNAGLDEQFVRDNVGLDISKWEVSQNILGNEVSGVVDGADTSSPDNKNEVLFADISSSGAIAVTIVWGIFRGPPSQRGLVEWDMVYDDVDFSWSATGEPGKMDFENIASHEIGHAVGMGHPSDGCTEETMFRYASTGETKKRTLEAGDIAGIKKLY